MPHSRASWSATTATFSRMLLPRWSKSIARMPTVSCASKETTAHFWKRKSYTFMHSVNSKMPSETACIPRSSGCAARPKARTTKSKSRIDKAHQMIGELAAMNNRSRSATADLEFSPSERQTKQLIKLEDVSYGIGGRKLFKDIRFTLTSSMRVGLVGPNGSGKTTLLRLLLGTIEPESGQVHRADALRITYFDQNRELDPSLTLRRALAPDSDSVIYQDRVIHVGAWAARFLFTGEDLARPVSRLSGGERARVLIAQLMLQPADVLLLDEPTNDLDIATLEILEESLLEYSGALVLVTHDRYMLDRVSTVVLGLDGLGEAERFADYSQWDSWQRSQQSRGARDTVNAPRSSRNVAPVQPQSDKKKLSFGEVREFETIEKRIADAEHELQEHIAGLKDPALMSDPSSMHKVSVRIAEAQKRVEDLYARWSELGQRQS